MALILSLLLLLPLPAAAGGQSSPPRGWNNYCAHLGVANESVQLGQAQQQAAQLLSAGYDTFVLDGGWSGSHDKGTYHNESVQALDGYGRPVPSDLYPSAQGAGAEGAPSLRPLVDKVHGLGLKMGVWHIRGAHQDAVRRKLPVKGTGYTIDQIVWQNTSAERAEGKYWQQQCNWDTPWVGVNHSHPAAQAYYDSLAELFVKDWGLDFVKFDCSYIDFPMKKGGDSMREIHLFYKAMSAQTTSTGARPILSLSPGGVREDNSRAAYLVHHLPGTMYRIWPDYWGGMPHGQLGESATLHEMGIYLTNDTWPDWDLLASIDQLKMTLWSIARSPIMYSAELPASALELSFLTNDVALQLNAEGKEPRPFNSSSAPHTAGPDQQAGEFVYWTSRLGTSWAVAVVNIGNDTTLNATTLSFADFVDGANNVMSTSNGYDVLDVFANISLGTFAHSFNVSVSPYETRKGGERSGAKLFLVTKADVRLSVDAAIVSKPHMGDTQTAMQKLQPKGFVGTYHTAAGIVADGHNTSAYDVGSWGIVASTNEPSDGGMSFADGIDFHCKTHDVNSLLGMLIAHSEGGTFNNTNDSALWSPLATCSSKSAHCDPRGAAGMLQGASRWSTLAREHCPQIAGVVIDDFWSNYIDASIPEPGPDCPSCPPTHKYGYGSAAAGYFCCAWPLDSTGHCVRPSSMKPRHPPFAGGCCLWPGMSKGCQSDKKCDNNPKNATPCALAHSSLGMPQMQELQAALHGKVLRADGTVDHSSPSLTPHLKIYVVTYEEDLHNFGQGQSQHPLIQEHLVDGISYWISGSAQLTASSNLTSMIAQLKSNLPENFPVLTGGYLIHSRIGWLPPASFYDTLSQSIDLYDTNQIEGFFVFSGSSLQAMNASEWQNFDLPNHLQRTYFPYLGTATVSVTGTGKNAETAVAQAVVTALYNGSTAVARKVTSASSRAVSFGGWTGKSQKVPHTVTVSAPGYGSVTKEVQLQAGRSVSIVIKLVPSASELTQQGHGL
jgi:alpha-galactosidase